MPDVEEQERSEESTGEEGRPLAIAHGNQVLTLLRLKCSFVHCLALINRVGGLYGRMLAKVVSTDPTQ